MGRFGASLFATGLLTCILSASSGFAQSDCKQWDISGKWDAMQSNKLGVNFNLRQNGSSVQGTAQFSNFIGRIDMGASGGVAGRVSGNKIELNTEWGGVYVGRIDSTGRIDGTTYDKKDSRSSARWYSHRRMECLTRASDVRPGPAPSPQPSGSLQLSTTCRSGYVWRVARPDDLVCVTPGSRAQAARENSTAVMRRDPQGRYGPNSCKPGFVWRQAFEGDGVCVTPDRRAAVLEENRLGASRRLRSLN